MHCIDRFVRIEHPDLKDYVLPPTAIGILTALQAACPDGDFVKFFEMNRVSIWERRALRTFLAWSAASHQPLDDTCCDFAKALPIYEVRSMVMLNVSRTSWTEVMI